MVDQFDHIVEAPITLQRQEEGFRGPRDGKVLFAMIVQLKHPPKKLTPDRQQGRILHLRGFGVVTTFRTSGKVFLGGSNTRHQICTGHLAAAAVGLRILRLLLHLREDSQTIRVGPHHIFRVGIQDGDQGLQLTVLGHEKAQVPRQDSILHSVSSSSSLR